MTKVQLFVLGCGGVGRELLEQIAALAQTSRASTQLVLCGVANSRTMLLDRSGIAPDQASRRLERGRAADLRAYRDYIDASRGHRILVDVTATPSTSETLCWLRQRGVSIVSANKHPFAGAQSVFDRLTQHSETAAGAYFETTVGAALPIVGTIRSLIDCGDEVHSIEGVFSGTLSFVFDQLGRGRTFSEAIRQAHDLGYTEPDPREDLRGKDVARKLLILARVTGARLDPNAVAVSPLIDDDLARLSLDRFWERVHTLDEPMSHRLATASKQGGSLAYLARFDQERASVSLASLPDSHPAARIDGTDNLFAVTTARYPSPLIVRGAGAGREVTASGVLADILLACSHLA